ncbi:hypothetical protein IWQ60_002698 [Tieghemiomyces parasiticus]|uniref:Required for respiratory growth protein 7, mitochondrial n=1 Tax=Tieghemiomyces parasiticus TaxID=78921 RepID=A0A9W8ABQ2_9FUNG|nr:hypothetical protein IWQ60_002698 [Tieghemiomyces parasiticus]
MSTLIKPGLWQFLRTTPGVPYRRLQSTYSPAMTVSASTMGFQYERAVALTLRDFGMDTMHSGRVGDRGIDFRGTWQLTSGAKPVGLVGQCKFAVADALGAVAADGVEDDEDLEYEHTIPADRFVQTMAPSSTTAVDPAVRVGDSAAPSATITAPTGPSQYPAARGRAVFGPAGIRDMEGVLSHHPPGTLGLLVSNRRFGMAAVRQAMGSNLPLLLVNLAPPAGALPSLLGTKLQCTGFQWNYTAEALLPGLVAVPRYPTTAGQTLPFPVHPDTGPSPAAVNSAPEIILLLHGRKIQPAPAF